ncbi:glycoprotein-N-acetylgalactosamine 3-beta-galactosyltransferase [Aureococcus anophagefferens]|uniref:Glycoprotein-N-acetylgalactosamine 3-beta-galactosyltransferase n=1 Tax=Aureococcus anophagefferens TaxID=44056 RepID=A0ABR1GE19_AURAN
MWQKIRSMWKYAAAHYLDQYDWFFIGGEDLYVIPQNLRDYLATRPGPETPQFLGRRFATRQRVLFNSGGAGTRCRGPRWKRAAHAEDASGSRFFLRNSRFFSFFLRRFFFGARPRA